MNLPRCRSCCYPLHSQSYLTLPFVSAQDLREVCIRYLGTLSKYLGRCTSRLKGDVGLTDVRDGNELARFVS